MSKRNKIIAAIIVIVAVGLYLGRGAILGTLTVEAPTLENNDGSASSAATPTAPAPAAPAAPAPAPVAPVAAPAPAAPAAPATAEEKK